MKKSLIGPLVRDYRQLLGQWSLTFLASGIGFIEDDFSTDRGGGGDGFRMIPKRGE